MDIEQILENAKRDPTLFANINIHELFENLNALEPVTYLANMSLSKITAIIYEKIKEFTENAEEIADLCDKLAEYRYVEEIFEIQKGKYIRTMDIETGKMALGGIVMDIKFTDNGTYILCKNKNRFFQIHFDKYLFFQKLSMDEQLYLMACDYIR
jgi:hypothetical protein